MLSFHDKPALKQSVLLQLEDQIIKCELQPLRVDGVPVEIYAAPGRPDIDYPACAELLGLPEGLLRLLLLEADWASYVDMKEAVRETAKEALEFFQAIPVGSDLSYVGGCYLEWLVNEPSFGAARYEKELGDLLPATLVCLETGRADDELLEKIHQFQEMAEARYLSLYDDEIETACRWSRVGQMAGFLASVQHYLKDNSCISQERIEHLLLMGISHVNLQQPDTFKAIAKMNEKLFSLLR